VKWAPAYIARRGRGQGVCTHHSTAIIQMKGIFVPITGVLLGPNP
jgi:hypothetical protein